MFCIHCILYLNLEECYFLYSDKEMLLFFHLDNFHINYSSVDSEEKYEDQLNMLFKICHTSNFHTSVQVMENYKCRLFLSCFVDQHINFCLSFCLNQQHP